MTDKELLLLSLTTKRLTNHLGAEVDNMVFEAFEDEDGVLHAISQSETDPNNYVHYSGKAAEALIEALEETYGEESEEE